MDEDLTVWGRQARRGNSVTGPYSADTHTFYHTASESSSPLLRHAGVHRAQVDLPLVLQLQVSVAEDPHQDAGAHVVDPGLRGAHGDLDLVAGLLVGVFRDVGCEEKTDGWWLRRLVTCEQQ